MGAYSPAPVVTAAVHERVMREVIEPTLRGLAADGTPYTGFLYAGLMIDAHGAPRVHRIQLPLRRSGDAADAGAARSSDLPALCKRRSTAGSTGQSSSGIRAPRSAW